MKPKRIILLRHSISVGNEDESIYKKVPDFAVELSENGIGLAHKRGGELYDVYKDEKFFAYVSPYYRTRQTFGIIGNYLNIIGHREEVSIREQEWCNGAPVLFDDKNKKGDERDEVSKFYYRFEGGEANSCVYDRISSFLGTMWRDFEKPDFPENCILFTHGMAMRVFLMRWFHLSVEDFELLRNPPNCSMYTLELGPNGKYEFPPEAEFHEKTRRKY